MSSPKSIKTIVFFFINPIRASRRESFQLERLENQGYNIFILDATKFYNSHTDISSSVIYKNTIECQTKDDFIKFKKSLKSEPVLFVASDRYLEIGSSIFNLIISKEDKLLTFKTKSFSDKDFTSNLFRKEIDKTIRTLDEILPLHLFKYYYKWKYQIFTPDYFLCSTKFLIPSKVFLTVKKSNRIIAHADDINETFNKKSSVINSNRKIGVFIDQGVPFLSDTHPLVYPPGTLPKNYLKTYYEELERTLNQVKEHLELDEIVISMHPSTVHFQKELKGKLSGYNKFIWKTPELIRDSHVVLTHCSTALSYAVFYNKPIILLESEILNKNKYFNKSIEYFKGSLNLNAVYMDNKIIDITDLNVDHKCYENYLKRFLKDSAVEENAYYYAITKVINDYNAKS